MSKFEDFGDLFDWNRDLMDDDFNDGQAYVVKHKLKIPESKSEFGTTVKVGHASGGSSKLAVEEKFKTKVDDFGGLEFETKFKSNGDISGEIESNYLRKYEGFEGVQLVMKNDISKGVHQGKFGFEFDNDYFKSKTFVSTDKAPKLEAESSYRHDGFLTLAQKHTVKDLLKAGDSVKSEYGFAGHFNGNVLYGGL